MAEQPPPAAGDHRWPLPPPPPPPPPPSALKFYTRKKVHFLKPPPGSQTLGGSPTVAAPSVESAPSACSEDLRKDSGDVGGGEGCAASVPPESEPPALASTDAIVAATSKEDDPAVRHGNGHDAAAALEWRRLQRCRLLGDLDRVRMMLKRVDTRKRELADIAAALAADEEAAAGRAFYPQTTHDGNYVNSQIPTTEPDVQIVSSVPALLPIAPAPAQPPASTPITVMRCKPLMLPAPFHDNEMHLESLEKEKRTPKANQYYRNDEFLLAKDKLPPGELSRRVNGNKKQNYGFGDITAERRVFGNAFKKCSSLLSKLMKHKHGWVFNQPVDTVTLGCYDYFDIIKHPMDFGTIKGKMSGYRNPREFADDVRLTFRNAMAYNPKGHPVHTMAEELSEIFESSWLSIEAELVYLASYEHTPRKLPPARPPPLDVRVLERSDSTMHANATPLPTPVLQTPNVLSSAAAVTPSSLTPRVPGYFPHINRPPAMKKPKAKDLYKREMTFEEKKKLSQSLQNLPLQKLEIVVQLLKSKNLQISQHDEEIEVDIDGMDTETLWELDRFVMNYKKNLSKHKRKAERAMLAALEEEQRSRMGMQNRAVVTMPMANMSVDPREVVAVPVPVVGPPVPAQEVQKGENPAKSVSSSSSSSDSGSSSSSDSDSDSSSGSDEERT